MKRRKQDTAIEAETVKISKFFQPINVNNDNRSSLSLSTLVSYSKKTTTSRSETLKKSTQVVPFNVSNLLPSDSHKAATNEIDVSRQKSSNTSLKLERFVHTGKDNEDNKNDSSSKINNTFPHQKNRNNDKNGINQQSIFRDEAINNLKTEDCSTSLLTARKLNLKLTPLELQIVNIKEQYPDLLLVVECGYKYQFFGEDAEMAGQILNMMTYMKHSFLSCSFPVHRLLIHVKKLVAQGIKVGVVRQKETSALKATGDSKRELFIRELCNVYTKATFIDETEDPSSFGSHQCFDIPLCLTFVSESYGKSDGSAQQIATIAFFTQDSSVVYDYFQDDASRTRLDEKFTHWQPVEIVVPDRGISNQTMQLIKQFSNYKSSNGDCIRIEFTPFLSGDAASDLLFNKIYSGDDKMTRKLKDLPSSVIQCLAMAYQHLTQFKMEQLIKNIKNMNNVSEKNKVLKMDGVCVRNLKLVPLHNSHSATTSSGTVFEIINRCRTKFGVRLLRSWILKPLACRASIIRRQEAVQWFIDHNKDEQLIELKKLFKALPDLEKRLTAVMYLRSQPKEFHTLCRSWIQLKIMCKHFDYEEVCPSIRHLTNSIEQSLECVPHFLKQLNKDALNSGDKTRLFTRISDYPAMNYLLERINAIESELESLKQPICKTIGQLNFNYVTVGGCEYLIEVKNALMSHVPSSWIKISATKQCARFRSPEVAHLFNELCRCRELYKTAAEEAWINFQGQVSAASYSNLKRANSAIATLDVLMGLSDVAVCENYSRPIISQDAEYGLLEITNGYHPVLSRKMQHSSNAEYVPNDTHLSASNKRCMILTGPNMGGKSCYLSQVAIIVVLAQIGSFVPAAEATLGLFESIFMRMGLYDEIFSGKSTFFVEMMETSSILKNSSNRSLVIIDELGRGTGTHDGSALAYATLKYLVTQTKCISLFVTHYPAVVALSEAFPDQIVNYHMGYFLDEDNLESSNDACHTLIFLYALTAGKCPKSFGLNVARLAGVQKAIIDKAHLMAESFLEEAESQRRCIQDFRNLFAVLEDFVS